MFHVLILSLAFFQAAQQPQQPAQPMGTPKPLVDEKAEKCTLEGKVVSSVDGQALKKAVITLMPQAQPGTLMPRPTTATTDADGKFLFKELDAGRYSMNIVRNGYARQNYGARLPNGPGTALALLAGQHLKDINVRLTPGAAISGRIVDEDNDPVSGVYVSSMRWGYMQGKRQLMSQGSASTDDRGQFRIYGLAPGRYIVSANYRGPNAMMLTGAEASPKESEETYAPTYYPGTFDVGQASTVELKPGDDILGVVFRLTRVRAVRVSGMVRGLDGEPLKNAMIQLLPRGRGVSSSMDMVMRVADDRGTFNFTGVMPGAYVVLVRGSIDQQQLFGRTEIDVATNPLDNVTIQVISSEDLEAEVHFDGSVDLSNSTARLMLSSDDAFAMAPPSFVQIKQEGTVTLPKVYVGNYMLRAIPLPEDAYLSKATFDDKDVLSEGFKFRGGGGKLDITISSSGARLEGVVRDKDNQPFQAAMVVLVPEESKRSRNDLFRTANSDQYGHFTLRGIPPGTYKLFAWEAIDFGAYLDPEFLKPFEDQGKTLQLGPSERQSPELRVIPSAKTGS